jgi:hypothetical protein
MLTPSLILQQLGDSLGKGAFAQVFRGYLWLRMTLLRLSYLHCPGALNWTTGETVAIKQIQLSTIAKGDLGEIMVRVYLIQSEHRTDCHYPLFYSLRSIC